MILGFAHLAVNVSNMMEAEEIWLKKGYLRNSLHIDVPNHPSKKIFLNDYKPLHNLMLMNGIGLWPLELTYHGSTNNNNNTQITWGQEAISITVQDPIPLRHMLIEGLGFKQENNYLSLNSHLSVWSCRLKLNVGVVNHVSLEAEGPTCLAFYSTRPNEDSQNLITLGAIESSGSFDITIGNRSMQIVLLRAPGGPFIELINLKLRT